MSLHKSQHLCPKHQQQKTRKMKAVAVLRGDSSVAGTVFFEQAVSLLTLVAPVLASIQTLSICRDSTN